MALQTMYINATEVWCYRSGWKSDIARFGTASGGHYTHSQIKFTPSAEDLAKLRKSRITILMILKERTVISLTNPIIS